MATGQKLRGFVGQGMSGLRKAKSPLSYVYSPGSYTLNITKPGWYRFVLWGPGGFASAAISSGGALVVADRLLGAGQRVSIVVGSGDNASNIDSTITLPDGSVLTAGRGTEGATAAGGVATGNVQLGDTLVNGGAAGGGTPGVAASSGTYRGGSSAVNKSPGNGAANIDQGGDGLCIVHQTRLRP